MREQDDKPACPISRRDLLKSMAVAPFVPLTVGGLPSGDSKVKPSIQPQHIRMQPFTTDWRESSGGMADVSFLLEAPAGKGGFIRVSGGHLVSPDGSRFRIWGVNLTAAATRPSHQDAPAVAAYLARFGVNGIRFHWMDAFAPEGLIDSTRNDSQHLDPEQLDRLDFFIAELKKRGIYVDLNLNVARRYKQGDGVRDYELLGFGPKALTYFDPRLLEFQRQYARKLLTHYNPYTQSKYCNEPAVLMVELLNENSVVQEWVSGRLLGKNTRKNPGTWTDIPASYARELTEKYNAWLSKNLTPETLNTMRTEAGVAEGALVPRLQPAEFATASSERFETEARFYIGLERTYFRSMGDYLKDELKVKPLVVGTSDHDHYMSGYPLLSSVSELDIVDGHDYWQLPRFIRDPVAGTRRGFEIPNTPMVNDPLNSTVVWLSRSPMAGKPFTVSEVNHPFPNEYRAEGIPILAAYAAFQDWDGVLWYTFEHHDAAEWQPAPLDFFSIRPDPAKMVQLAAGALIFLRPDVRPAEKTIERSYSMRQVYESLRLPDADRPYFTPGFPQYVPLQHGTRIGGFDHESIPALPATDENPIRSDTDELAWYVSDAKTGIVSVDTPRSQALIGFVQANSQVLSNLSADVHNQFCCVTLGSLDGRPVAHSAQMLLTTASHVVNTGMKWNRTRTSLVDRGTTPTLIEPVTGTVTLRSLVGAQSVEAIPLDSASRPLGTSCPVKKTEQGWEVSVGTPPTTWYLIRVERGTIPPP